jgi:hypothetical protein
VSETPVRKVASDALSPGEPTPGIAREQAIVLADLWSGRARTVHRESNPTDQTAEVVLVRRGTGPVTVNVEGPAVG